MIRRAVGAARAVRSTRATSAGRSTRATSAGRAGRAARAVRVLAPAALLLAVTSGLTAPAQASAGDSPAAGTYTPLAPARILDTRAGNGAPAAPVAALGTLHLAVDGRGNVPAAGVAAVVLTVTVTEPRAAGFLTAYPSDQPRPWVSNLNFVAGQTVANLVTVPVGADGAVDLYNGSAGTVQVIADVNGWFTAGQAAVPGAFSPVVPARLLDTRQSGAVGAGSTVALQVSGRGGVPASGVAAVALNLTATDTSAPGYVTAYPAGDNRPVASNVNFVRGQTVPNATVVRVGAGGAVSLFNGSAGSVNLIADVAGYYLAGTATEPGTFVPLTPTRVLDTRSGAAVANGQTLRLPVPGTTGLVGAVVLNVTVTQPAGAGYVTAFPDGADRPTASNVNFVAGQTVPDLVTVATGARATVDLYAFDLGGPTHVIADLAGYYVGGYPAKAEAVQAVLAAINSARQNRGLPVLQMKDALVQSAHAHNIRMAQANALSHQLSGEADLGSRLTAAGDAWVHLCEENIGWNGDSSADAVPGALALHNAMMAEGPPPSGQDNHYSNIVSPDVHDVGVDVVFDSANDKIWLTEDFSDS